MSTFKRLNDVSLFVESKKGYRGTYLQDRNSLTDIGKQSHGYRRVTGREDKLGVWDEHTHYSI